MRVVAQRFDVGPPERGLLRSRRLRRDDADADALTARLGCSRCDPGVHDRARSARDAGMIWWIRKRTGTILAVVSDVLALPMLAIRWIEIVKLFLKVFGIEWVE